MRFPETVGTFPEPAFWSADNPVRTPRLEPVPSGQDCPRSFWRRFMGPVRGRRAVAASHEPDQASQSRQRLEQVEAHAAQYGHVKR